MTQHNTMLQRSLLYTGQKKRSIIYPGGADGQGLVSGFNAPKLALCYFESGMESRSMRVWGWVLLIGGFLFCASIVWAVIGFLLMGLGLIFLQIAEDKTKRPATGWWPSATSRVATIRAAGKRLLQLQP
jgi:hypothetical protein